MAKRGMIAVGLPAAIFLWVIAFLSVATTAWAQVQVTGPILDAKRGFADTSANFNDLQASNASWYYTWGPTSPNINGYNAMFYPMFWNGGEVTAANVANVNTVAASNAAINPTAPTYALGFNEPEVSTQANMTVASAISSWQTLSADFTGTNIKLVSPAVSDTSAGQQWLSGFMSTAKADNLKVDAVAFHWYGVSTPNDPVGAANSFLSRVDSYHNSYGLPVFITEFAIHDWGGVYTDAQIIEANREFLNVVIPGLESRSYVVGYSWYNWFSDDPLYTTTGNGNNQVLTPTTESYSYIGSIGNGTTTDAGGQNLGQHVADMAGGTLTMSSAGTVNYINALAFNSAITGAVNWTVSGSSNWVKIQSGATLNKTGANQVSFTSPVTNNGVLEVSQGTLQIGSSVSGTGSVMVNTNGTMQLTSAGRFNNAPLINVQSGGNFDYSALTSGLSLTSGHTLNNDGSGKGNVVAGTGSTVSGGGTFTGNVTANNGSTIQIGAGGAGVAARVIIDNFENYTPGAVATVATPAWTANAGTTEASIVNTGSNQVLSFGSATTAFIGVDRTLPAGTVDPNSSTAATYFFRINSATDTPNHNIGLGDQASTQTVDFTDFETQLRLKQGTSAGTFAIDARSGANFSNTLASNLSLNTWYNIWMVVHQSTDTYDIYMNTGAGNATTANKLNTSPLSFRNGTTQDLNEFLAYAGAAPIANGVSIDDIIYQSGTDLTNPEAGFNPGLTWNPATMTVNGAYTQSSTATLALNLLSPSQHDMLSVSGKATLAGILNVTFAVGAPTPQIGDAYQILQAGSISGTFSTLQLPPLTGNMAWDTSQLYTLGVIDVVPEPGSLTLLALSGLGLAGFVCRRLS
jgi:hypothetical protein